jgi:hypothetical protein
LRLAEFKELFLQNVVETKDSNITDKSIDIIVAYIFKILFPARDAPDQSTDFQIIAIPCDDKKPCSEAQNNNFQSNERTVR